MAILYVQLLGDFRLMYGDMPVAGINQTRLQSLLAYLVLHRGAPQARHHLAFLFWPDSTEAQARTNLRKALLRLRRALPDANRFWLVGGTTLQWRPDAPFWLDVADFEDTLAQAKQLEQAGDQRAVLTFLQRAVDLYQGDLLPGCYDEWVLPERERLRQAFIGALEQLILLLESMRDYRAAISYAQRLLRHDPLHESTYRHLMRLHALTGDRAGALRVYHTCTAVLQRELGVEPSPNTRAMYERLLKTEQVIVSPAGLGAALAVTLPLVGREQEWVALQAAWQAARVGPSHFVLIAGESGIGKSRLAEELLLWANRQGISTASAQCYAAAGELAYAPVATWLRTDVCRSTIQSLDKLWLTEVARLLPELLIERSDLSPPAPMTEAWQRRYLFEALAHTILAVNQPLLLLLDDLQWCDRETLEWLHYLLHFDTQARLLIVGTCRLEEVTPEHPLNAFWLDLRRSGQVSEITLGPLSEAEIACIASKVANQALDPALQAHLYRETEGNPLFAVETIRACLLTGNQAAAGHSRTSIAQLLTLPPKVQAVLSTRLAQFSPAARELVSLAATIGRSFTFDVVAAASESDEDTLVQGLDELWQRRIIRVQGVDTYDFSHDKLREVAYVGLSPLRRRLLHRRVAQALEAVYADDLDVVSGQAAAHFEKAGMLERAFQYYMRAADHEARLYAYYNAERLYKQAIAIAGHLNVPSSEVTRLYSMHGRMLEHAGRYADAIQVYQGLETVARQRSDKAMESVAVARLATCYIGPTDAHNVERAEPLIKRGLALAREISDYEQEVGLLWSKMVHATHYGRTEEAQAAGEASIAIARQHGLRERLAYVLHDLSLNLRLSGHLEQGTVYAEESRTLFREFGNLPLLVDNVNQQALIDYLQLDFRAALQHAAEAYEISQEIKNGWNLAYSIWIRGMVRAAQGEWGQAQADWEESMQWGQDVGFLMALTTVPLQLGDMLRDLGQIQQAQVLHQEAHEASERLAPFMLRAVEAQLALDAFAAREVEAGYSWLCQAQTREPLGEIGMTFGLIYPANAAVSWAEYGGAWEFALIAVKQAMLEAQRRRFAVYLPSLLYDHARCLEGLGRMAEAEASYREALAVAERAGLYPVQWWIHAALFRLRQAQGCIAEAEIERQAAAKISQRIANSLIDSDQRKSFLSTAAVHAFNR